MREKVAKELWDRYYTDGYIYDITPSEGALKAEKFLNDQLSDKKQYLLVEPGCGYARDLIFLLHRFKLRAIGIDISEIALTLANKLIANYNNRLPAEVSLIKDDAVNATIRTLKENKNNNVILYTHYFLQVLNGKEKKKFIFGISDGLKKGDLIIFNEYSIKHPRLLNGSMKSAEEKNTYIVYTETPAHKVHFFKEDELVSMFNKNEWDVLKEFEYQEYEKIKQEEILSINWFVAIKKI